MLFALATGIRSTSKATSKAQAIPAPILAALASALGISLTKASELVAESGVTTRKAGGAYFVSYTGGGWFGLGGKLISAYYHPTCVHRASTKGKLGLQRSVAPAGEWAVSEQTRDVFGGNLSNYLTCCGMSEQKCEDA